MRPTIPRLIIVDGFAGTGKSTTAQWIWLQGVRHVPHRTHRAQQGHGRRALWFHEHQAAHPIFCYDEVEELLDLKPGPFEDRILANWSAFARDDTAPAVRIIEGSLFQLTVGVMLALNVPSRRIERTLVEIERLVSGLAPALVYLFYRNTRHGLLRIRDHRGGYWLDGMTAILGRSPYGRRHRVRDVDGLVAFYRRQRAIIETALARLTLRRLAIDISGGRWDLYRRRMAAFLALGRPSAAILTRSELLRHVGRYRGTKTRRECLITTDAASLYLQEGLMPAQRLLPIGAGSFCVESLPIGLQFASRRGEVSRVAVDNRLMNGHTADRSFTRCREKTSSR